MKFDWPTPKVRLAQTGILLLDLGKAQLYSAKAEFYPSCDPNSIPWWKRARTHIKVQTALKYALYVYT